MAVKKIIDVLKKQDKVYQKLMELTKKMNEAIIDDDIKLVDSLIQEQVAYLMGLSALEKERIQLVENCAKALAYEGEEFNIKALKQYVPPSQAQELSDIEKQLKKTIAKLDNLNRSNQMLIKSRLNYINFSLKLLGKAEEEGYKNPKEDQQSKLINELI